MVLADSYKLSIAVGVVAGVASVATLFVPVHPLVGFLLIFGVGSGILGYRLGSPLRHAREGAVMAMTAFVLYVTTQSPVSSASTTFVVGLGLFLLILAGPIVFLTGGYTGLVLEDATN